jgi:predicted PurR-regulated permease PerM
MTSMPIRNNALLKTVQLTVFTAAILYFGRTLFVPMCYGLLIAIVLYPVVKWLELRHWPRSLAIAAGLLIVFFLFAVLILLLVIQVNVFREDLPQLMTKLEPAISKMKIWLNENFGIAIESQNEFWKNPLRQISGNSYQVIPQLLSATAGGFVTLFLVPVYAALFLYNRRVFVSFLERIVGKNFNHQLRDILNEVIHTYFNFIKGMVIVYLIVGVLNSIGLLLLGIPHAILFGMLTAVMTIIPYIGIIISALLPISIAWITKDSIWYPLGVVAVFGFVQYLEANVIFPKVVASQLKVSTWATLVAIFAGGILWGVSGMILFIPFVAIFKIVSDAIPSWKSVNILFER